MMLTVFGPHFKGAHFKILILQSIHRVYPTLSVPKRHVAMFLTPNWWLFEYDIYHCRPIGLQRLCGNWQLRAVKAKVYVVSVNNTCTKLPGCIRLRNRMGR